MYIWYTSFPSGGGRSVAVGTDESTTFVYEVCKHLYFSFLCKPTLDTNQLAKVDLEIVYLIFTQDRVTLEKAPRVPVYNNESVLGNIVEQQYDTQSENVFSA